MSEVINKAREFAIMWHGDQEYDGKPYVAHLDDVYRIVTIRSADVLFGKKREDAQIIAYLHDILEDTPCTLEEINQSFGETISNSVEAMTKRHRMGIPRFQKEAEYLRKVCKNRLATFVKICDRESNVLNCIRTRHSLFKKYKREHTAFFAVLAYAYPTYYESQVWKTLNQMIDEEFDYKEFA